MVRPKIFGLGHTIVSRLVTTLIFPYSNVLVETPELSPAMPRNAPIVDPVYSSGPSPGKPWAFWPTLGLSFLTLLLLFIVSTVVAGLFMAITLWRSPQTEITALSQTLPTNGFLLSISTLLSGILCTGLLCAFIKMCPAMTIPDYLGLQRPSWRSLLIWNLGLIGFIGVADWVLRILNQTDVFIEAVYQTAQVPGLLFVAVVIIAPIFEELLFRGFMFKGLQSSRLGVGSAIVISSGIWAVIHLQYNGYFMGVIFGLGILLGLARWRTRSTYVPIAMHGLNNLIAFLGTVLSTS